MLELACSQITTLTRIPHGPVVQDTKMFGQPSMTSAPESVDGRNMTSNVVVAITSPFAAFQRIGSLRSKIFLRSYVRTSLPPTISPGYPPPITHRRRSSATLLIPDLSIACTCPIAVAPTSCWSSSPDRMAFSAPRMSIMRRAWSRCIQSLGFGVAFSLSPYAYLRMVPSTSMRPYPTSRLKDRVRLESSPPRALHDTLGLMILAVALLVCFLLLG